MQVEFILLVRSRVDAAISKTALQLNECSKAAAKMQIAVNKQPVQNIAIIIRRRIAPVFICIMEILISKRFSRLLLFQCIEMMSVRNY